MFLVQNNLLQVAHGSVVRDLPVQPCAVLLWGTDELMQDLEGCVDDVGPVMDLEIAHQGGGVEGLRDLGEEPGGRWQMSMQLWWSDTRLVRPCRISSLQRRRRRRQQQQHCLLRWRSRHHHPISSIGSTALPPFPVLSSQGEEPWPVFRRCGGAGAAIAGCHSMPLPPVWSHQLGGRGGRICAGWPQGTERRRSPAMYAARRAAGSLIPPSSSRLMNASSSLAPERLSSQDPESSKADGVVHHPPALD
ncbi:hypothetical protein BS78_05G098100 [Paspalum vaginatum]|nr:hypothetical protein BS78_05G098100 [Paspalum vaginatum]